MANEKERRMLNIRLSEQDEAVLDALRERLGLDRSSVVRLALRRLNEAEQAAAKKLAK